VASRTEGAHGFALVKEYRRLTFPDRELRSIFDFAGALLGKAVNEFPAGLVEPFKVLQKNDISIGHVPSA
jgi:hypothetical protein